jgi:MFS family permease
MPAKSKETDQFKQDALFWNSVTQGLFMSANYVAIPTRAPLVLAHYGGDAIATASLMSAMSSACAATELFTNPVLGSLADRVGRRPLLMAGALINGILHTGVGLFPKNIYMNFIDRTITGAVTYSQLANSNAVLSDLFEGEELAAATSYKGTYRLDYAYMPSH